MRLLNSCDIKTLTSSHHDVLFFLAKALKLRLIHYAHFDVRFDTSPSNFHLFYHVVQMGFALAENYIVDEVPAQPQVQFLTAGKLTHTLIMDTLDFLLSLLDLLL